MAYIAIKADANANAGHTVNMAGGHAAVNAKITAALANDVISGDTPSTNAVTQIQTDVAALFDLTTVDGDITTALAVTAIAGDTGATDAVNAIQIAVDAYSAAITNDESVAVMLAFDPAKVTTKNQLRAAVAAMLRVVEGSNDLS